MNKGTILIWSVLLASQFFIALSAAQCKTQLTPNSNNELTFQPMKGNMEPASLSTKYDAKGLQPFFNLANSFMDTVQGKKLSEEFKGYDLDDITNSANRDKLIKYETPVIIAASFGVLFLILMPFIGLFFCCCRCCGKCGGKRYQDQKAADRHFACKIMTGCLFIVSVMMLCGCMFMFVTNTRTHETAQNLGGTYVKAVDSVVNIANSTKNILNDEIVENFVPCLLDVIKADLSHIGIDKHFGIPLKNFINANVSAPLDTAGEMAKDVDSLHTSLSGIKTKSDSLKTLGTSLESKFTNIETDLDAAKADCGGAANCLSFIDDLKSKIKMDVDFGNLPNIQTAIDDIKEVQDKDLAQQVQTGRKTVTDIPKTVRDKTKPEVDKITNTIGGLQTDVENEIGKITKDVDNAITTQQASWKEYEKYFDTTGENFKYENYRSYAYVGLSSLIALIVVLLFGGLALGICGYSKDVSPSNRSKTATCGGHCLMASVGFMFIFSFFLMLFCTLWYVVGIHLHFVCRDLKDASIFDTIIADKLNLQLETDSAHVSVQSTLNNCRDNMALYQSMGGSKVFNLSSKLDFKALADGIDTELADIQINLDDQSIMTTEIKEALEKLKTSTVDSIDFTTFFNMLNKSITANNLTDLANNITSAGFPGTNLPAIATKLKDIDSDDIPAILSGTNNLKPDVTQVQTLASNLKDNAGKLLTELQASDDFIKTKTGAEILSLITSFTAMILNYLVQGTDFVLKEATTNLLKCKPVADVYDGLFSTLLCDDIVQNANGFWLALGWCLLFFIPAIILSVKLAKYYRRMEYDSGLDEFEHPPFNDKIPLQTYDHNPPPPYQNQGYANH